MTRFLKSNQTIFFRAFSIMLFSTVIIFGFSNEAKACSGHIKYYEEQINDSKCHNQNGKSSLIKELREVPGGKPGECKIIRPPMQYCKDWQVAKTGSDYGVCKCEKECLEAPFDSSANPLYYDDPKNHTRQTKSNQITLPVVLAWNDIAGWKNKDPYKTPIYKNGPTKVDSGPQSYRVEIKYEEYKNGDANLHIDKTINPNNIEALGGGKIFFKVIADKNNDGINDGFNSREDGGACFFNTNTAYQWRVRPCCDANGEKSTCKPMGNDEGWWTFTTGPGPEPLGIVDNNHPNKKNPTQDPDWNGPDKLANVNFCSAKLHWCKAKLMDENNKRFSKNYNTPPESDYAVDYQMRVKFNETWSLMGLLGNIGGNIPDYQSIMQNALSSSSWSNNLSQAFSDYLSKSLAGVKNKALNAFNQPESQRDGESCHYLELQNDGTCKPEHLSFSSKLKEIMNDKNFWPSFSASENTSQNRSLFTGNLAGNLTYSWQLKVCFNRGDQKDKQFPFCATYNNEDYGQKWKFSGEKFTDTNLTAPAPLAPPNNKNKSNRDPVGLVGEGGSIQWTAPCGANSFLYDIKDAKTGASIFEKDKTYTADQGRRVTVSQILISLTTDKDPAQENDPGRVKLKLDTLYQWQVKSCWPSIPMANKKIDEICSKSLSPANYFYTTGRPPLTATAKTSAPTAALEWESVPGAGSYRVKITGPDAPKNELVLTAAQYSFNYSAFDQKYDWTVKTCADAAGQICGAAKTNILPFKTADFDRPTGLAPKDQTNQLPPSLSWNGAAKYYQVSVQVANGEDSTSCDPKWFNDEYKEKCVAGTSLAIQSAARGGSQYCGGQYSFSVQPAFDPQCKSLSSGAKKATQTFSIIEKKQTGGLMVCGQNYDDDNTEYNEKEPCQIKHLFLLAKVIIDFTVFKLALWLLPIAAAITGGIFYLAQDKSKLLAEIKDTWRKIGIGYLILIFAWIIVSLLMQFAGYSAAASWNALL